MAEPRPDAIDAEAFSVAELRDAALGAPGKLARPLALILLGRKNYPGKAEDFERLLHAVDSPPRIRHGAAIELGRIASPQAVAALERGLALDDDLGLRGVLEALTVAKTERVPAGLERLVARRDPVGIAARRTMAVLTHRLGLPGPSLDTTPPTLRPLEWRGAQHDEIDEAIGALAKSAPGLHVDRHGAVALRCVDRDYLLLSARQGGRIDVAHVLRQRAEVAVVMSLNQRESRHWSMRFRVTTEPSSPNGVRIVVSTARGEVVLTGAGRLLEGRATFELRSTGQAGGLQIEVDGEVVHGAIRILAARSGAHRAATPSPTLQTAVTSSAVRVGGD